MASTSEVITILDMLVDSNLSFPPRNIEATAGIWARLLWDIPGETLEQAAIDHVTNHKEFPKVAEMRELSERVKSRNGKSAAPNQFRDETRTWKVFDIPWMAQVTKDGWLIPVFDTSKPRTKTTFDIECERLEEKYCDSGLPTDNELYHLEELSGRMA